jgi:hypothetical protein
MVLACPSTSSCARWRKSSANARSCAALDERLGKSPVAAAHVDPPLVRSGRQPIEKDLPHESSRSPASSPFPKLSDIVTRVGRY